MFELIAVVDEDLERRNTFYSAVQDHRAHPSATIIVASGLQDDNVTRQALALGAAAYVDTQRFLQAYFF